MENILERISQFSKKVKIDFLRKGAPGRPSEPGFVLSQFWLQFCIASQETARASSKISICFSKKPLPSVIETSALLDELIKSYNGLFLCFSSFPNDHGRELLNVISDTTESIQVSLLNFLSSLSTAIQETKPLTDVNSIGVLLKQCDQVISLPKDNREAVVNVLKGTDLLIADTVNEITEELRNQINVKRNIRQGVVSECEDVWSDNEYKIVTYTLHLCKSCRQVTSSSLKFLRDQCAEVNIDVNLLDEFAKKAEELSPSLDNLVCSIYPPIEMSDNILLLETFVQNCQEFVETFEKFPNLKQGEKEMCTNIKKDFDKVFDKLKTCLVSLEILGVSNLSINEH